MGENKKNEIKGQNEVGIHKRSIRSFVKRSGRLTPGQQNALEKYWPLYGLNYSKDNLLSSKTLFPNQSCLKLEIGFGNGESLVHMAQQDKDCGYLGIEVHEPGVGHCLKQIHEHGLENLKLASHDAIEVIENMLPLNSLDAVFLFFPDPWHKKRHHKRRIVNQQFRDLIFERLKQGAILHMATDWFEYAEYMAEELLSDQRFRNTGGENGFCQKPDYRPITKFERRGMKRGHGVYDLKFEKL